MSTLSRKATEPGTGAWTRPRGSILPIPLPAHGSHEPWRKTILDSNRPIFRFPSHLRVQKKRNDKTSHGLHHPVHKYVQRADRYLQRRRTPIQRWVRCFLHKMVNQTCQVKSSLPTVKWSSWISHQGDEENNPGRVRQQDEDSRQVRASGSDAHVLKHPEITYRPIARLNCFWMQSDRFNSVLKTDAAPTKLIQNRETLTRGQRKSTSRERFVEEEKVTSTQTWPASPISRPDYEEVDPHREGHGFRRDRPRLLGQGRWQSTSLSMKPTFHKANRRRSGSPTGTTSPGTATDQTNSRSWPTFVRPSGKSTTKTEYNIRSTEERVGKTEDRREDQNKNRSIRGRRGEAKDRQSWSTKERTKIDTLKKEKTLLNCWNFEYSDGR